MTDHHDQPEAQAVAARRDTELLVSEAQGPSSTATAAGAATSEALAALARAARAFLLYGSDNDAIGALLEELRARMQDALRHGPLELAVHPWTMTRAGEVVYREEDRERSLAFRLYRDGVRRLIVKPTVTWPELTGLLGVLSVRYTGVRQQEDDVVTLLWRADFKHVEVTSSEGFAAEDDEMGEAQHDEKGPLNWTQATIFAAPYYFSYPWPRLQDQVDVQYRALDSEALRMLQDEDGPTALPGQCVQMVAQVLHVAREAGSRMEPEALQGVLREVFTFLVAKRHHLELLQLVGAVRRAATAPGSELDADRLLTAVADKHHLDQLVRSALADHDAVQVVSRILNQLPPSSLPAILAVLEEHWNDAARRIGVELVAQLPATQVDVLAGFLGSASGHMAADLVRALEQRHAEHAVAVARAVLLRGEDESRLAALGVLDTAPYDRVIGRAVTEMIASRSEAVRCAAATFLAAKGEARAFDAILANVERFATAGMGAAESAVMGAALARIDVGRAFPLFRDWIRPAGVLVGLKPGREAQRWVAVSGLALIPGDASEELVRWLHKKADGALQQRCAQAMVQLRRAARGEGR